MRSWMREVGVNSCSHLDGELVARAAREEPSGGSGGDALLERPLCYACPCDHDQREDTGSELASHLLIGGTMIRAGGPRFEV
jgi:hypothetical protein